jgi:hypothetical protein
MADTFAKASISSDAARRHSEDMKVAEAALAALG